MATLFSDSAHDSGFTEDIGFANEVADLTLDFEIKSPLSHSKRNGRQKLSRMFEKDLNTKPFPEDVFTDKLIMFRIGSELEKATMPPNCSADKYCKSFAQEMVNNFKKVKTPFEILQANRKLVQLNEEEKRKFKSNRKKLNTFINEKNCPKIRKIEARMKKMKFKRKSKRFVNEEGLPMKDDMFGYRNIAEKSMWPLNILSNDDKTKWSKFIMERIHDLTFDFDYEKRAGFKERQRIKPKYLEWKKRAVEKLSKKAEIEEKKNSESTSNEENKNAAAEISPPTIIIDPPKECPRPNGIMQQSPEQLTTNIPSTSYSSSVVSSTATTEKSPSDSEKEKKKKKESRPEPVFKSIDMFATNEPKRRKSDEIRRKKKEQEDIERKRKEKIENERKRKEFEHFERKRREEEQRQVEEDKRLEEERIEKEKKEREKAEMERIKNVKEAEEKRNQLLKSSSNRAEQLIEKDLQNVDQEAVLNDIAKDIAKKKQEIERFEAVRKRNIAEAEQRRMENEKEEERKKFDRRRMLIKSELFDDGYDKQAKKAESIQKAPEEPEMFEFLEEVEEIPEVEEEEDEIIFVEEIVRNAAAKEPIKQQKKKFVFIFAYALKELPKRSEKDKLFKQYYNIDNINEAREEIVSKVWTKKPIECKEDGLDEDDLRMELFEHVGQEINDLCDLKNDDSRLNKLPNDEFDYTRVRLKDLEKKMQWPFKIAQGVYFPIMIVTDMELNRHDQNVLRIDYYIKNLIACHSFSGYYNGTMSLTNGDPLDEVVKRFEAAYADSGDDRNCREEWLEYNKKPGRFSNRNRYKLQSFSQDRAEASKRNHERFRNEVEKEDRYFALCGELETNHNDERLMNVRKKFMRDLVRQNRVDRYSLKSDFGGPGKRENEVPSDWVRSGFHGYDIETRDEALGRIVNDMSIDMENIMPHVSNENEIINWAFTPMLASLHYQLNYDTFAICKSAVNKSLTDRREEYEAIIKDKNKFSLNRATSFMDLTDIEKQLWPILFDQLTAHFKKIPTVSQLMDNPKFKDVVDMAFTDTLRKNS